MSNQKQTNMHNRSAWLRCVTRIPRNDKPQTGVIHQDTQKALTRNHLTNHAGAQGQSCAMNTCNYTFQKQQPLSSQAGWSRGLLTALTSPRGRKQKVMFPKELTHNLGSLSPGSANNPTEGILEEVENTHSVDGIPGKWKAAETGRAELEPDSSWIPEQDPSRKTPWEDPDWGLFPDGKSEPWNCLKDSTRISCQMWRCYQTITQECLVPKESCKNCPKGRESNWIDIFLGDHNPVGKLREGNKA